MTAHAHGAPAPAPAQRVSAGRLIATLGGAGLLAGLLIVVAYETTTPAIEAHRARRLQLAVSEVLKGPARYDTLYLVNGALRNSPPAGVAPADLEPVYLGRNAEGQPVGYAVVAGGAGFQDQIQLIFGYDPETRKLLGMKVLESKETPGLGDKIEKDTFFVRQFGRSATPLKGVKPGARKGAPGEVDLITGATISSRAIVKIINDALARLGPALEAGAAP
jgi:electron transport complex protein RnfG